MYIMAIHKSVHLAAIHKNVHLAIHKNAHLHSSGQQMQQLRRKGSPCEEPD